MFSLIGSILGETCPTIFEIGIVPIVIVGLTEDCAQLRCIYT